MPLEIIATLATTLAQWLQIRKDRRDAQSQRTIEDYKDWLRREEHADLADRLADNRELLEHIKQLIEDRSLDSIVTTQQLRQAIEQRLTIITGGIVGQNYGNVTVHYHGDDSASSNQSDAPRPIASPPRVSIAHLPNTGEHLFGRDPLLEQLDDIWREQKLNVLAIIAPGGVGKSALVNTWLDRLAVDGWRGAQRVYGHSFYSQGTRHETASTDQFIADALEWFGDPPRTEDKRSPWARGQRLAELVRETRTLLILDGMEPLQLPPGPNEGRVNDPALQALLRDLAAHNPGLCIITSRMKVTDLERHAQTTRQIDLETLPPQAGTELLRSLKVEGPDKELRAASEAFGSHALALTLLGKYLTDTSKTGVGDIRKAMEIRLPEAAKVVGDHAKHMMEWYEKWFTQNGRDAEVSILRMLGLFNRPAEKGCVDALRTEPPIPSLTDGVAGLSDADWNIALNHLREAGLIARPDEDDADGALDCHPLVREHFGERLRRDHPEAWRAGHDRLYEYLKGPGCTKEYPDTLAEMQPLYAAVMHGCMAERHQEALNDVYWRRINQGEAFFSTKQLGAFGAELGALAGFFKEPWSQPVDTLPAASGSFVVYMAGFRMRALGRLQDALAPTEAGLSAEVEAENWVNAAKAAGNLSGLLLTLGEVAHAVQYASESVRHADRAGDTFQSMSKRTALADALHQAGEVREAEELIQVAERMQAKRQPECPLLYSLQGHHYCDLLLGRGAYDDVSRRATQTLEIAAGSNWLLDIALDHISLGRAQLLQARAEGGDTYKRAWAYIDTAVDKLREAGAQEFIPRGLLARAELYIFTRDFDAARADLDEAYDIATRDPQGHMRLHVTDYHLLSAQLELAQADAELEAAKATTDATLTETHRTNAAAHQTAARDHVDKADKLIQETGYHRRDDDLKTLQSRLPAET